MNPLHTLQSRYTTKQYNSNKKIPSALISTWLRCLQLSPSSINSQPWHITVITDGALKKELAQSSFHNQQKVLDCSHLVVFGVEKNTQAFEHRLESTLPEGAWKYYETHLQSLSEVEKLAWRKQQVYLALGIALQSAAELGIDSTPMEGIDPKAYDKAIQWKGHQTIVALCLGYRDPEDFNQPDRKKKSRNPSIYKFQS